MSKWFSGLMALALAMVLVTGFSCKKQPPAEEPMPQEEVQPPAPPPAPPEAPAPAPSTTAGTTAQPPAPEQGTTAK